MLIVLGGLPGVGKTAIARTLAEGLGAVYLRIDTIEQAIRSCSVLKEDVGPAGYVAAYNLAVDNLRVGRIVVADAVNPVKEAREGWRAAACRAASELFEIEVICSDQVEHRRRVEERESDIANLALPTWEAVVSRRYEKWQGQALTIDTSLKSVEQHVADLIIRLGRSNRSAN